MNYPSDVNLAVLNIGGAEIVLILLLLLIVAVAAAGFVGLIYLIVRTALNRPPPAPPPWPSGAAVQDLQSRDQEHLKLLAIFHFVFAGLALVGMGFLCVHYVVMHAVFANPEMWKSQMQAMPPRAVFSAFIWLYFFAGLILLAGLVLNVLSGLFLWRKRNRIFSLVIAGLDCLQIPFGTALGVFTILVLSRERVRQLYGEQTVL